MLPVSRKRYVMNSLLKPVRALKIWLRGRWESYFFTPMSPFTLGLARVIIFGLLFWKSLSHPWFLIADWPPEFLHRTAVKELPYVTPTILGGLSMLLALFSLLGMVGLLTRWAATVCFIVLYLFNGVDGGVKDSGWLLFSFLLLMTCCQSEDALSLKSLWSRQPSPASWEYRWPLRVIQLTFIMVYSISGMYKLLQSGLQWTAPETLQGWYLFHRRTDTYYYDWGNLFLEYPTIVTLSAIVTLILEIGVVLILLNEKFKWVFVPGLILMHLMIGLTLNIWFKEYFFLLMLFFDWQRVATQIEQLKTKFDLPN